MSKQLSKEEILWANLGKEVSSHILKNLKMAYTGAISAMQQYADQEAALTESQRKEWADMCIKKQARIEELEKGLKRCEFWISSCNEDAGILKDIKQLLNP